MPRTKPLIDKNYESPKKETEKRKRTDIPKEFIKKIKNLGMKVEDAALLFKSKIDWCAVYSENKIYCVEPGCDYFTTIDNEDLTNHMINVHKYGDYPCGHDHCDYVATSKKALNYHGREIPFSPPKMTIRFSPLFGLRFKNINFSGDFGI